jgi:NAD-dependent deacetylase
VYSDKLLQRLKSAYQVTALTGPELALESGIKISNNEQKPDLNMLKDNPAEFWKFYNTQRELNKSYQPNLGHYALVDLEARVDEFQIITLNSDNLQQKAGSKKLIELYGNVTQNICTDCFNISYIDETIDDSLKCNRCAKPLRPNLLIEGDEIQRKVLSKAQEAAATCEIFLAIGITSLVEPAASLPYIAKGNGAYLVEINKQETELSSNADETIFGELGKILPYLAIQFEKIV